MHKCNLVSNLKVHQMRVGKLSTFSTTQNLKSGTLQFNEVCESIEMTAIFMNLENSRNSSPHILMLNLTGKMNLRRGDARVALSNIDIYDIGKNIKRSYGNNKLKISPTWNQEFELPDGSFIGYSKSVQKEKLD